MELKLKDCINNNCNNILYVADYQLHQLLMCQECINKKHSHHDV